MISATTAITSISVVPRNSKMAREEGILKAVNRQS
jgi:hypothetical protein